MLGDIFVYHNWRRSYYPLVGRVQDAAKHPTVPRAASITKNYPAPNVKSGYTEKLSIRGIQVS